MVKLLIVLATLGTTAGAAWWWTNGDGGDAKGPITSDNEVFATQRGSLNITITEDGTLVARDSESVSPGIRGRAKIEWLIEEGTQVEEGAEVARLDTTELTTEVESLELEELKSSADLETAKTELEIQEADNVAALEKAEFALKKATDEFAKFLEGDAPKERRTLSIAIKDAETEFAKAQRQYDNSVKLLEQDFVNPSEVEEHEISLERSRVRLESAQQDDKLYEKFTYPLAEQEKKNAIKDAERGLSTASSRAASSLRQKEVAVEQATKRVEKMREQLKEKREQIDKFIMTAPCPGIVLYGDPKEPWMRDQIKVGSEFWGRETLLTIPDLRVMQVKMHVHEADIIKVTKGLPVTVTMDTYPGKTFTGTVTRVGNVADSMNNYFMGSSQIKRFAVEITMDEVTGLELKPGISAKAEIFVEKKEDCLFVPLQCVFINEGVQACYVREADGQPALREVTTGSNNETYIEILDGLEEGDEVLLYNPNLTGTDSESEDGDAEKEEDDEPMPSTPATPPVGSEP